VGTEGMTGGPGPGKEKKEKENGFNSNLKQIFQIYSNLIRSKQDLSQLRKFEIKHGWKLFKIRNIFPYKNFLRFEKDFELKFREASMSWQQEKIDWNALGIRILIKLGQQLPFYTLLEGKINSQQKRIKNLNSF
jgi:hypothetical protein